MSSKIEKAENFAASKRGTLVAFTFTVLGVILAIVLWFVSPSEVPTPPLDSAKNLPVSNNETPEIIIVIGIGLAKDGESNPTIRYEMAKRAAEVDAMRKLAERIHVVVESVTKVQNKQFSDEEITLIVKAILKSRRVINVKENNDGSVEVTMEAPINSISILTEDK